MADFIAILRGQFEVPPVRTDATGEAMFQLSEDCRRLNFALRVNNIRNATEAHIHLGFPGQNGPIVAFLFNANRSGSSCRSGTVVEGSLTRYDLIGPLQGCSISDLVREIQRGNTYVNVHTVQNPNGEIRGQIVPVIRTMSNRKGKVVKNSSANVKRRTGIKSRQK